MRRYIITLLVGSAPSYPTGQERIVTVWSAILWRLASLAGLDAAVNSDGSVFVFIRR